MRRISTTLVVLCLASAAFAKDKPRVTVQVVETETSERQSSYVVPGTDAKSTTTCNKSASETVYGKDNGPHGQGSGRYRQHLDLHDHCAASHAADHPGPVDSSGNVEAIMADGTHVTLWCQAGFRQCISLKAGYYSAEVDGNTVWMYSAISRVRITRSSTRQ